MRRSGWLLILGILCATLAYSDRANASEPIAKLIPRLIEQGGWLRAHYPGQNQDKPRFSLVPPNESSAASDSFLGAMPHVSLVARDWSEAYSLTDGKPLLFDRVRMIRSSRMAVTRVGFSGGRFLPYAELSFGQWRPDTNLVPWLKSDAQVAAQIALGFEIHFAARCALAWDVEETQVYPDRQQNVPATRLMASFAVMRAEF